MVPNKVWGISINRGAYICILHIDILGALLHAHTCATGVIASTAILHLKISSGLRDRARKLLPKIERSLPK